MIEGNGDEEIRLGFVHAACMCGCSVPSFGKYDWEWNKYIFNYEGLGGSYG